MNRRRISMLAVVTALALALAACGGEDATTAAEDPDAAPAATEETAASDDQDDEAGDESFAFGEPADPADADRTVTVEASDDMAFDPPSVEVSAGEVVTFEVENVGQLPHDFTLGDEEAQEEHGREMEEMSADMAHADPNTMTLAAGETGSITWRFDGTGAVLYGCHQPGHYDAGMVGSVAVTP